MKYRYVIDTYAWIEYFSGSDQGKIARDCIEGHNIAVPSIVILELRKKLLRDVKKEKETGKGAEERMKFVTANSAVIELDYELAIESAKLDLEIRERVRGWSVADSIVLATARKLDAKVVTGDEHFRGLKEAVMIK